MRRVASSLCFVLGATLVVVGLTPAAGADPSAPDPASTTPSTAAPTGAVAPVGGGLGSDGLPAETPTTSSTVPVRQQTTLSAAAQVSGASFSCPSGGAAAVGSGASFPQIVLDQWRADINKLCGLRVDYQPNGSTAGRTNFINNAVDFGVSDISFTPSELSGLKRAFTYVPITAGGLGFMYNLKDSAGRQITDLRLSSNSACKIFTGQISSWNDPQIAADNNGRSLPNSPIRPVVRSDGSGTSYFFSQYCIDLQPDVWKKFASDQGIANAPTSFWPQTFGNARGANGSDGCANLVANPVTGKDAITTVEAGFAQQRGMPNAFMKNNSGAYVQPTYQAVTDALAFATSNGDGTQKLNFRAPGATLYNPSSYSYLIAPTTGFSPDKGKTIAAYIQYSVLDGQKKANSLGYAALPTNLVALALNGADKIPGAPPRPKDAPPPEAAIGKGETVGGGASSTAGRTTQVRGAQATNTGAASSGPPTPGPLGHTGSDVVELVPVGVVLIAAGELVRRRTKRRVAPR
ncbi:MAG: phosphate ABC transporter substrate-binding protein PstS [Acidimicrobiia bacterium]